MNDVRGIAQQQAALLERLHHEGDISLLEVTHTAVNQLGRPARGPLAEVLTLDQQGLEPARARAQSAPRADRPAAKDDDVPWLRAALDTRQHFLPIHAAPLFQPLDRATASSHRAYCCFARSRSLCGVNTRPVGRVLAISFTSPQYPVAKP